MKEHRALEKDVVDVSSRKLTFVVDFFILQRSIFLGPVILLIIIMYLTHVLLFQNSREIHQGLADRALRSPHSEKASWLWETVFYCFKLPRLCQFRC